MIYIYIYIPNSENFFLGISFLSLLPCLLYKVRGVWKSRQKNNDYNIVSAHYISHTIKSKRDKIKLAMQCIKTKTYLDNIDKFYLYELVIKDCYTKKDTTLLQHYFNEYRNDLDSYVESFKNVEIYKQMILKLQNKELDNTAIARFSHFNDLENWDLSKFKEFETYCDMSKFSLQDFEAIDIYLKFLGNTQEAIHICELAKSIYKNNSNFGDLESQRLSKYNKKIQDIEKKINENS